MADISGLSDIIQRLAYVQSGGLENEREDREYQNLLQTFGAVNQGTANLMNIRSQIVNDAIKKKEAQIAEEQAGMKAEQHRQEYGPFREPAPLAPGVQGPEEPPLSLFQKDKISTTQKRDQGNFSEELYVNPATREISDVPKTGFYRAPRSTALYIAAGPSRESALEQRQEAKEIRAEERLAAKDAEKLSAEQEKAVKHLSSLDSLVSEYFTELDRLSPPSDDLADLTKTAGLVGVSKVPLIGTRYTPELRAFDKFRSALRPKIARALGDVGNLTEQEQENAIQLLSQPLTSKAEREQAKSQIRNILLESEQRAMESLYSEKAERARGFLGRERLRGNAPKAGVTKSGIKYTVEE